METVKNFIFLGSKISVDNDCTHEIYEIKRCLALERKTDTPRQHIKKQRHYFLTNLYSQSYEFSSSHVWMWELDHKEGWVPKNWCFLAVMFEKTLESPLNCKEIQPVNPKGNKSGIFTGMTDVETETSILWPPDVKSWFIAEDSDAGKDRRQGEKKTTENELVGWHHWLDGHEFDQTPGYGKGQGILACCSPWSHKESDTTEIPNNNNSCLTAWFTAKPIYWHQVLMKESITFISGLQSKRMDR